MCPIPLGQRQIGSGSTTVDPTPAAHAASQQLEGSGPAASSSSHHDGIIEWGDYGDFDYDAVKADDGVELWLVRAPSTVRPLSLSFAFRFSLILINLSCCVDESEELAETSRLVHPVRWGLWVI